MESVYQHLVPSPFPSHATPSVIPFIYLGIRWWTFGLFVILLLVHD